MNDENDRCSVNLELEHDFDGHLHEGEDEDGIVQVGLSEEVKKKVSHYDILGVKPMAILRKKGVLKSIGKFFYLLSNFNKQFCKTLSISTKIHRCCV